MFGFFQNLEIRVLPFDTMIYYSDGYKDEYWIGYNLLDRFCKVM